MVNRSSSGLALAEPAPCAGDALSVQSHHGREAFVVLCDEWRELQTRAAEDNLFLTWEWQHAWWAELGRGQLDLVAFRDAGRLVGVAPAYWEESPGGAVVRFGGGLEVTDYLGFIVERGYEEAVGCGFIRHCLSTPGAWL